jgi:hypothetical protein
MPLRSAAGQTQQDGVPVDGSCLRGVAEVRSATGFRRAVMKKTQTEITISKLNAAQRKALTGSRPTQLVVSSRHNIEYFKRLGLVAADIHTSGRSSATLTPAGNRVRDSLPCVCPCVGCRGVGVDIGSNDELRGIFVRLLSFVASAKASHDAKNDALQCIEVLQARLLP